MSLGNNPEQKTFWTILTLLPTISQYFWKNKADIPSGSGALMGCIVLTTDQISLAVGIASNCEFSSLETLQLIKSASRSHLQNSFALKSFLNSFVNEDPISSLVIFHTPSSSFTVGIKFLLRFATVDAWKNLEFLSPSLSHISWHFCLHNNSNLFLNSFKSLWSSLSSCRKVT